MMRRFSNLRIRSKLALGFAIVIALVAIIASVSFRTFETAQQGLRDISRASSLATFAEDTQLATHAVVERNQDVLIAQSVEDVGAAMQRRREQYDAGLAVIMKAQETAIAPSQRAAFAEAAALWRELAAQSDRLAELRIQFFELRGKKFFGLGSGTNAAFKAALERAERVGPALTQLLIESQDQITQVRGAT